MDFSNSVYYQTRCAKETRCDESSVCYYVKTRCKDAKTQCDAERKQCAVVNEKLGAFVETRCGGLKTRCMKKTTNGFHEMPFFFPSSVEGAEGAAGCVWLEMVVQVTKVYCLERRGQWKEGYSCRTTVHECWD